MTTGRVGKWGTWAVLVLSWAFPALAQLENDRIGFSPNHVFDGAIRGENIDVLSGNLSVRIPIGPQFTLSPELSYQVQLFYNSKIWEHECPDINNLPCPGVIRSPYLGFGVGWVFNFGRIWKHPKDLLGVLRYQRPDGSETFIQCLESQCSGSQCPSPPAISCNTYTNDQNATHILGNSSSFTVTPGDGTRLIVDHWVYGPDLYTRGWYVSRIETIATKPDGTPQHWVDINYGGSSTAPSSIVDSVGREITFAADGPNQTRIDLPSFDGSTGLPGTERATWRLTRTLGTLQDPTLDPADRVLGASFLTAVHPPQSEVGPSEHHAFEYQLNGMLRQWQLPAGATLRYEYTRYYTGEHRPYNVEASRRHVDIGDQTYTWHYRRYHYLPEESEIPPTPFITNPRKVLVRDPFGNLTGYYFNYSIADACKSYDFECPGQWRDGLLTAVHRFAGPNEGENWVESTLYTHTNDGYFDYRAPAPGINQPIRRTGRSTRTESTRVRRHGSGANSTTETKSTVTAWYNDYSTPRRIPTEITEYATDGLIRRVTKKTPASPWTDKTVEIRDATGQVLSRTDRFFSGGRMTPDCEVSRAGSTSVTLTSCENLQLNPGDVAKVSERDPLSGHVVTSRVFEAGSSDEYETHFTYSPCGHLETKRYGDLDWYGTDRDVDCNTGLVSATRDPAGVETGYAWDGLGRLRRIETGAPSPEAPLEISYPSLRRTEVRQEVLPEGGVESAYEYDELGRLERTTRLDATGSVIDRWIELDIEGATLRESGWAAVGTPDANRPWTTYQHQWGTTALRDPLGRVSRVLGPQGQRTDTSYSGLDTTVTVHGIATGWTEESSSSTTYRNDEFGRLIAVESPAEGARAVYRYDPLDRLIEVELRDPESTDEHVGVQRRFFEYDRLGRLRGASHPESGTTTYESYDARGLLTSFRDARGELQRMTHDVAGRLLTQSLQVDGSTLVPLVENHYDDGDGFVAGPAAGKLTQTRTYAYDATEGHALVATQRWVWGPTFGGQACAPSAGAAGLLQPAYAGLNGRLLRASTKIEPLGQYFESYHCYDRLGVPSVTEYPKEAGGLRVPTIAAEMRNFGFTKSVYDPGRDVPYILNVTYDVNGAPLSIIRGNGLRNEIARDIESRPESFAVKLPTSVRRKKLSTCGSPGGGGGVVDLQYCGTPAAPSQVWGSGSYAYDDAGNVTRIGSDAFYYDRLSRLLGASIQGSGGNSFHDVGYSYDPFGNLVSRERLHSSGTSESRSYEVDPQTNRLTHQAVVDSVSGASNLAYAFDAAGNMTEGGSRAYRFDVKNRVSRISDNAEGIIARYAYDSSGYRVRSQTNELDSFFVRDGMGRLVSEFRRGHGTTTVPTWDKDYLYLGDQAVVLLKNDLPARPPTPVATAASATQVVVEWDPVHEPDISHYTIRRTYRKTPLHSVEENSVDRPALDRSWVQSFAAEEILIVTVLTYEVTAYDSAGNKSDPSSPLVLRPLGDAPPTPEGLQAFPTDRAIVLRWNAVVDDDLWGYEVFRLNDQGAWVLRTSAPTQDPVFVDSALENGLTYEYHVVSVDTSGRRSQASGTIASVPLDNVAPGVPLHLTGSPGLAAQVIDLKWTRVMDSDLAGYRIYRSAAAGDIGAQVGEIMLAENHPTAFQDGAGNGVTSGVTWYYRVASVDSTGNESLPSAPVAVRSRHQEVGIPTLQSAVLNIDPGSSYQGLLFAENNDIIQVLLDWDSVGGASTYRVYRARGSDGQFALIHETPTAATQYTQYTHGPLDHFHNRYFVVATKTIGGALEESGASQILTVVDEIAPEAHVRDMLLTSGRSLFHTKNRRSRAVFVEWSRVVETQLVGYHVYRRADWTGDGPAWSYVVQTAQTEYHGDNWLRVTPEPVPPNTLWFIDSSVGGLNGKFEYTVRPVWPDGSEGAVGVNYQIDTFLDCANILDGFCAPEQPGSGRDQYTHNIHEFWHYPYDVPFGDTSWYVGQPMFSSPPTAIRIPVEQEHARINSIARGQGDSAGSPPPPTNVSLHFRTNTQGVDPGHYVPLPNGTPSWPFGGLVPWGATPVSYRPWNRPTRYVGIEWDPDYVVRPADLAGYHVEMAGSFEGPWRRITPRPVAWWESHYAIPGLGVRRTASSNLSNEYSGHPECWHFRVVAVDAQGLESVPTYPSTFNDQPSTYPRPGCPATPLAPVNLRASTGPSGWEQIKLEWDPVAGAHEYHVYRMLLGEGEYFYRTHRQAASAGTTYVETGDFPFRFPNHSPTVDDNVDCPGQWAVPFHTHTMHDPQHCRVDSIEAFYVTARGVTGGESPRSNLAFWDPITATGYELHASVPFPAETHGPPPVMSTDDPGVFLAASPGSHVGPLPASAYPPLAPASSLGGATSAALWDNAEDDRTGKSAITEPESAAARLAPLRVMGQSGAYDPPYKILDLHFDHLGSTRVVTDDTGAVMSTHKYFPFGEEVEPMLGYSTKQFTGHERDRETGLDYMLARYYGSSLSRFASSDPVVRLAKNVVQPMRWNRYTYVLNNPMAAIDPDGRDTYRVNRKLGGDSARSKYNLFTHTFYATTDNGKVTDTYSWGNNGSPGKWHKNAPEDMKAAQEAINKGMATRKGGESLDAAMEEAYETKKDEPAHANLIIDDNCKEEADDLLDAAKKLEDEKKSNEDKKKDKDQRGEEPAGYGIDPDGPYRPLPNPCAGMGPMCR